MNQVREKLCQELDSFLENNLSEKRRLETVAKSNNKTLEQIKNELVDWRLKKLIQQFVEESGVS